MTKLSGGQNAVGPLLEVSEGQVIAGRDDTTLVDAANEFDDNFLGAVIINDLKLSDVSVSLHEAEESDDDLGRGSDDDLLLAFAFCVDEGPEGICQDVHFHHSFRSI